MPTSLTQPLAPIASGDAAAAQPLLAGTVATPSSSPRAAAVRTALRVPDTLVAIAAKSGLLFTMAVADAPARSARARSSGAGYAKSTSGSKSSSKATATSSSAAKKSGALAFLDDPKLSVDDKLMRLLAYLNEKWEKDIEKKMKEAAGGQTAARSTGTSGSPDASNSKKSGILDSIGSVAKAAKEFLPAVGVALKALDNPTVRSVIAKLGGPVLAAAASAIGMPALAPALLRYGPQVIDVAAGVASAFADEANAASGGSSSSGASSAGSSAGGASAGGSKTGAEGSSGSALSDREMQVKLMEIQRVMDQQKEMFSLVSNMLKSAHDTRMAVIQNVR